MTSAVQHTTTHRMISWLVVLAVTLAPLAVPRAMAQDVRAEARQHYMEGKSRFGAGDYQGAIQEFETANRLAPSPILHFNIGLAYERLGNKSEALRHYRTYLDEMPQAPNRSAVEGQIQRLEAELRQAQTPAPAPTHVAPQPGAAAGGAAGGYSGGGMVGGVANGGTGGYGSEVAGAPQPAPAGAGSGASAVSGQPAWGAGTQETAPAPAGGLDTTDAPSPQPTSATAPTGDPLLDRVAAIDVALIRDQRAEAINLAPAQESAGVPVEGDQGEGEEEEAKPPYKQVWFWVVAGVSAIILIDIATSDGEGEVNTFSTGGPALLRF